MEFHSMSADGGPSTGATSRYLALLTVPIAVHIVCFILATFTGYIILLYNMIFATYFATIVATGVRLMTGRRGDAACFLVSALLFSSWSVTRPDDDMRLFLYRIEIEISPNFEARCAYSRAINIGTSAVVPCSTIDFGLVNFMYYFVKIDGPEEGMHILERVRSGEGISGVEDMNLAKALGIWPKSFSYYTLSRNIFLIKYNLEW